VTDDGSRWWQRAACRGRDTNLFFPERKSSEKTSPGLGFCSVCEVRQNCETEALERGERYGIWGGMTSLQLRRLGRQRRRQQGVTSQEP
jgi:WhiB family redox-sensing transcriptional regulator